MARTLRRHFRTAQKEVQNKIGSGISIPEKYRKHATCMMIAFIVIVFAKGILLGYIFGKSSIED